MHTYIHIYINILYNYILYIIIYMLYFINIILEILISKPYNHFSIKSTPVNYILIGFLIYLSLYLYYL